MANEFKIRNGFISSGDSEITGSLGVSQDITISGTLNVSTLSTTIPIVSGSSQIDLTQTTNYNPLEHFTSASITITESQISDLVHYTNTDARSSISLTTTGTSGAATYSSGTGVFNIPNYTLAGLGYTTTRSIANITGTKAEFDTAVTDGNFMYIGDAPTAHTHTFASLTSKPTTVSGYGITDTYTKTEADGKYLLNTTDTLTGNLTVTGILTAQEFHTEFISSSIIYESGSTKFGDSADDTHQFTGSLGVTGTGTFGGDLYTTRLSTSTGVIQTESTNTSLVYRPDGTGGHVFSYAYGSGSMSYYGGGTSLKWSVDSSGNSTQTGTATFGGDLIAKGIIDIWGNNGSAAGQIQANSGGGGLYLNAVGTNQNIRLVPTGTGFVQVTSSFDVLGNGTFAGGITETFDTYNQWILLKQRSDNTQKFGIREVNSTGDMALATDDTNRIVINRTGVISLLTDTISGGKLYLDTNQNGYIEAASGVAMKVMGWNGSGYVDYFNVATYGGAATFSGSATAASYNVSALNTAPSSASDTGTTGEIRYTSDYIYVCTATDTWNRVALATW